MNKKTIQVMWIKSIITIIWLFSWLSTVAYAATWEVSLSDLKNSAIFWTEFSILNSFTHWTWISLHLSLEQCNSFILNVIIIFL